MIVYDLICARRHTFEGWFASTEDFECQRESTLLRCPVCDDLAIERLPSANIQVGRAAAPPVPAGPAPSPKPEAQALELLRRIVQSTENVGHAFAEEARKIHYEEVPARGIRGNATAEEAAELRDEGIEFMSVPSFLTGDLN